MPIDNLLELSLEMINEVLNHLDPADLLAMHQVNSDLFHILLQRQDEAGGLLNWRSMFKKAKLPLKSNKEFLFHLSRLPREIAYLNQNPKRFAKFQEIHEALYMDFISKHNQLLLDINLLYQQYTFPQCDDTFKSLQGKIKSLNTLIISFQAQFCTIGQGNFASGQNLTLEGITRLQNSDIVAHWDLFDKVTCLSLKDNFLGYLPSKIGDCHQLTMLNLYNNPICFLPASLAKCQQLTNLCLSDGYLPWLPSWICSLENLKHFYCVNMQLEYLPRGLIKNQALITLCLNENHLSSIPKEIFTLPNLREIHLTNNPISKKGEYGLDTEDCKQLLFQFKHPRQRPSKRIQDLTNRFHRFSLM